MLLLSVPVLPHSGFLSFASTHGANLTRLEISFPVDLLGDKRTAYGSILLFSARLRQEVDGQAVNLVQLELESETYRLLLRAELDPLRATTTSTLVCVYVCQHLMYFPYLVM